MQQPEPVPKEQEALGTHCSFGVSTGETQFGFKLPMPA